MTKSSTKVLRNGKVVLSRKNSIIRKNNGKISFSRTSKNNSNCLHIENKTESNEILVIHNKDCDEQNNYHDWADKNNQHCKKTVYNKLENHIQLNEVQIYNNQESIKLDNKCELITLDKTKKVPPNSLNKKNNLKTNLVNEQINNVRITRSETIKLQTEKRKKLDQVLIDKFPKNTFKNVVIQLYDIVEQVKFLRMVGLMCRYKCSLSNSKVKKNPEKNPYKKIYFSK